MYSLFTGVTLSMAYYVKFSRMADGTLQQKKIERKLCPSDISEWLSWQSVSLMFL